MTKLSVNINKFATLRNARGGNNPDILKIAKDCQDMGANGITVHPRPDERHIRYQDVRDLKPIIITEYNIEGYPSVAFCNLVNEVKPTQVTLVPDTPDQITSNHGWNTERERDFLKDIVEAFHESHIRVSIFIDPDNKMAEYAKVSGADRVELYTEPYAKAYKSNKQWAIKPFIETAHYAKSIGLGINAGHDLSLENLSFFYENLPIIDEVSIGHALVCDALYMGLNNTIREYLACIR